MPIAEPVGSPLWNAVQGLVRWPTANEDVTAQLGRDWDDAVAAFRYAASNTKDLPHTAWPDEVGAVFDQKIAELRDRVHRDADGMARLARITTAYGEDVGYAKGEIVRVLPSWEAKYQGRPEVAEGFASLINAFLTEMADRIRSRGAQGPEAPNPERPTLYTAEDVIALAAAPPPNQPPLALGPDDISRINRQKQDGHIFGTPQYKNRLNAPTPPGQPPKVTSYFWNARDAYRYVYEAWHKGTPVPNRPGYRELTYSHPVGIGPNGGYQYTVRVVRDANGEAHGYPSGPETPR
jgi:hypothetical protein